jgi:hypothetical protein
LIDKKRESHGISVELIKLSSQSLQDPIDDVLEDLCSPSHVRSSNYGMKSCYDLDMVRQSTSQSSSTTILLLNPSKQLQPYQKLHEDENSIDTMLDHVADLDEFKNQGTG